MCDDTGKKSETDRDWTANKMKELAPDEAAAIEKQEDEASKNES